MAWAFLKPFPAVAEGPDNAERKVRLQLFRPGQRRARDSNLSEAEVVWRWWQTRAQSKYPASLYVTVQAIDPPEVGEGKNNSQSTQRTQTYI